MEKDAKIFIAGHGGLVGSHLMACLAANGYRDLITCPRGELDLTNQAGVDAFFASVRPDYVFVAAAKVGGIGANSAAPADFMMQNLLIECHLIDAAFRYGTKKLLFLGSSCIYPRLCPQPIREDALLTGPLEPTNDGYALAKIAGVRLIQAYRRQYGASFISVMPTNLYGPGDCFDLESAHVLPALIRRMHEAKTEGAPSVTVWGSGRPLREFLYAGDLADACVFLMEHYDGDRPLNIGSGEEISIADLASLIADVVGYRGDIILDPSKPDGMPRKRLDLTHLHALGWRHSVPLREGIERTYDWYLAHGSPGICV